MNIGIIIQARMGSTRLPGKILKPFYLDETLIDTLLANLHKIAGVKIVIATSVNENNDQLENYLLKKGELVYRGAENDVIDRFIKAAETNKIEGIIRICSDNPFLDWRGVKQLIERARKSQADYIGFRINDKPSILTHFGFWGEFVKLEALRHVAITTPIGTPAHEHVTYYIYNHPNDFKCEWIMCPNFLQGRDDIRLTIDTAEDFANAQKVYRDLKENNKNFTLQDVVNYLDEHKEIKQSMLKNINQNKK